MIKRMQIILSILTFCLQTVVFVNAKPLSLSSGMIGAWKKTADCKLHSGIKGQFTIRKENELFRIQWDGYSAMPLGNLGDKTEKDTQGNLYRTISHSEVFNEGKRLVMASIWKNATGEPVDSNIAVIMTTYQLQNDGTLVYEKYGYSAYSEDKGSVIKSYSELVPGNNRCIFRK
jgi:hypothetical protein